MLALAAAPAEAVAKPSPVTEFSLTSRWISGLAQGPDGTIWYAGTVGQREHQEGRIGRVGVDGPIGEAAVAGGPRSIAIGDEGDAWFFVSEGAQKVGRLSSQGVFSPFPLAEGAYYPGDATASAGGGIWFTMGRGTSSGPQGDRPDTVGRITASGAVTEFPLPQSESRPGGIVESRDGSAWFTEYFGNRIGRIDSSGQLTEFPLPAGSLPIGITVDADGNVWFTESGSGKIGRIDPAGNLVELGLPPDVRPLEIAAGADGRIWFTRDGVAVHDGVLVYHGLGGLGRITPAGRYSEVLLPNPESDPDDIVAGDEGSIWYSAMGERPCEGGGMTCMMWEPKNPAIVGRVSPTPLTTAILGKRSLVSGREAGVVLACEGGNASDRCRGKVELKLHGTPIGSSRYSLAADQRSTITIAVRPKLRSLMGRRMRARVLAKASASTGRTSRRELVLVRSRVG